MKEHAIFYLIICIGSVVVSSLLFVIGYLVGRYTDIKLEDSPKRINSKRPSFWMSEWGAVRIFYPNGEIGRYDLFLGWIYSIFSDSNPEVAIKALKQSHTFLGYL